ncbi:MAG: glycine dehydrogenase (aminomethyl-transferring), partial [Chthoniobacterales bacterium]
MSRAAATDLPPFSRRHIGPDASEIARMLGAIGCASLDQLIDQTVPEAIRFRRPLTLPEPLDEHAALAEIRSLADENIPRRSFIGMGYHNCHVPPVILRNVLENPGWYTAYTPYQAELAQGRLEALLNFQTMVSDLTGMEIANASLLDESTAAAEAMAMAHGIKGSGRKFFVADNVHPQTIALLRTRSEPLGIEIVTAPWPSPRRLPSIRRATRHS